MNGAVFDATAGEALRVLVGHLDAGERALAELFAISQITLGELEAGDVTAADLVCRARAVLALLGVKT